MPKDNKHFRDIRACKWAEHNYHGFAHDLPDSDDRLKKYKKQRAKRGFDNSELWNLNSTIAKFILPRLKAFRADIYGIPGCFFYDENDQQIESKTAEENWCAVIDTMIYAFEEQINEDNRLSNDAERNKRIDEGMNNFAKYFGCLWN